MNNSFEDYFHDEINSLDKSYRILQLTRQLNINASVIIGIVSLIGNILVKLVFIQRRFRTNPSHVYLLCAAVIDSLFILVHFFEDTIRTYKDVYSIKNSFVLDFLNLTDKNIFTCRLINYARNCLRFISAYIVVAFTIHRVFVVFKPLSATNKRKKLAFRIFLLIVLIGLIINIWVPFMFQVIKNEQDDQYCDINQNFKYEYFSLNILFVLIAMLVPMLTIVICNTLIIFKTIKCNRESQKLQMREQVSRAASLVNTANRKPTTKIASAVQKSAVSLVNVNEIRNNSKVKQNLKRVQHLLCIKKINAPSSLKMTMMLLITSFSFVVFNLPYLITWSFFFYQIAFDDLKIKMKNYLFALLQLAEIFYFFNYGFKFFIFCVTESRFREKLRRLSIVSKKFNSVQTW